MRKLISVIRSWRYMSAYDMATAERNHIAAQKQTPIARAELKELYEGITAWETQLFPPLNFDHTSSGKAQPAPGGHRAAARRER
jgi:hypothetical protein